MKIKLTKHCLEGVKQRPAFWQDTYHFFYRNLGTKFQISKHFEVLQSKKWTELKYIIPQISYSKSYAEEVVKYSLDPW